MRGTSVAALLAVAMASLLVVPAGTAQSVGLNNPSTSTPTALYFHLFETRFWGGKGRESDFAEWIRGSLGNAALADRVANIDPYMFSLEQVRKSLLRTLMEAR